MSNWLLLFLIVLGFFAMYWVLKGQWDYNKMMRR